MTDADTVKHSPAKLATTAWNDARIEMLKVMWGQGHPASEISDALGDGISRNAVIGKAHRMGLSGRASPIKKKLVRGASLLILTERMCRWPIGDPSKPDFYFCANPTDVSATYCPTHRAIAIAPPKKPIIHAK